MMQILILAEIALSYMQQKMYSQAIGTTDETSIIYESERQIPVHFHLETEIAKTQQINCGPDLLQTLANLGDGMHFIGKIDFIGAGTYGAVFSVNKSVVVKLCGKWPRDQFHLTVLQRQRAVNLLLMLRRS